MEKFATNYVACSKGIEISDAGPNPKSITQALSQLKYALSDSFAEDILHQVDHLLGPESPIFTYAPFIVTTADLWRLKEGVTIADIRGAKELPEVATSHDLLFCFERPDNKLQKFTSQTILSMFDSKQIQRMDTVAFAHQKKSFKFYVDYLSGYYPCFFAIIKLERLSATLARTMEFFGQKSVFSRPR
jgi:hypothetical protein